MDPLNANIVDPILSGGLARDQRDLESNAPRRKRLVPAGKSGSDDAGNDASYHASSDRGAGGSDQESDGAGNDNTREAAGQDEIDPGEPVTRHQIDDLV